MGKAKGGREGRGGAGRGGEEKRRRGKMRIEKKKKTANRRKRMKRSLCVKLERFRGYFVDSFIYSLLVVVIVRLTSKPIPN